MKVNLERERHQYAIYCHSSCGPSFGYDITIFNNANTTMDGCSNLGNTYSHPQYACGTNEARTFLGGSYRFQLDKIEVYQKE
jgi:hypothetical protein